MFAPLKHLIMVETYKYAGNELELFKDATNWKQYVSSKIKHFIGNKVLEVGAGIGSTTKILNDGLAENWTMLEPDENMHRHLCNKHSSFPGNTTIVLGKLDMITELFDTILYIDVLEHIENDQEELENASRLLVSGGKIIVLSPAFNFLFSQFDKSVDHCRRYVRNDLRRRKPEGMTIVFMEYLDTLGFFASAMNKIFLRQSYPTKKQIHLWDKKLIPLSRIFDKLFFHSFGKTILVVFEKK